ncbi:unnamed protein product [Rotaria sordida]|uniref:Uncharacterized protein n=2 Tax=Rotaria sordida TaxID=392033 RepID=A0A815FG10_9BILA|nr:unnamed protein product [Rotaria sordida]CAF1588374.1 unnamed protein product [Rotaria sordida]
MVVDCSESSNCSLHHVEVFNEKISSFVPMSLWETLSDLLYSSTSVAADLVCLDSSDRVLTRFMTNVVKGFEKNYEIIPEKLGPVRI